MGDLGFTGASELRRVRTAWTRFYRARTPSPVAAGLSLLDQLVDRAAAGCCGAHSVASRLGASSIEKEALPNLAPVKLD